MSENLFKKIKHRPVAIQKPKIFNKYVCIYLQRQILKYHNLHTYSITHKYTLGHLQLNAFHCFHILVILLEIYYFIRIIYILQYKILGEAKFIKVSQPMQPSVLVDLRSKNKRIDKLFMTEIKQYFLRVDIACTTY